jgi:RNA polymerase sigma-70 factor (sigma-E family)
MKQDGDQVFSAFVAARLGALVRTAFLLTGDAAQAEDLVQTALTSTYVHWGRVGGQPTTEAYVRRAMVNTYTSWWRRHRGRESLVRDFVEGARTDLPDDLEAVLARSTLWPHLARLPRGQRAVVVLRYYEDLTEVQIAQTLGISPGTVKSQCSKGLATLRAALEHEAGRDAVPSTGPSTPREARP